MATVALSGIITPSNVVTATSTTTLTNKTLTAPTIASGNLTTALTLAGAAGTNGQVLTSAGSGLPTWSTPNSGALVFISSQTVSSAVASVDFTSGISATYDDYVVNFEDVTPGTTSTAFYLRLYKNGAFSSSGYSQSVASLKGTPVYSASSSSAQINMTDATVSSTVSVLSGSCTLLNMNSASGNRATAIGKTFFNVSTSAAQVVSVFGGSQSSAFASTGFQFLFSSGNITSGTFRLYGVAKA